MIGVAPRPLSGGPTPAWRRAAVLALALAPTPAAAAPEPASGWDMFFVYAVNGVGGALELGTLGLVTHSEAGVFVGGLFGGIATAAYSGYLLGDAPTAGHARLVTLGAPWLAGQGLLFAVNYPTEELGLTLLLTAPMLGPLLGTGIWRVAQPDAGSVWLGVSAGLWTGLLIYQAAMAAGRQEDTRLAVAMFAGSNLALAAGMGLGSDLGLSGGQVFIANVGGLVGWLIGTELGNDMLDNEALGGGVGAVFGLSAVGATVMFVGGKFEAPPVSLAPMPVDGGVVLALHGAW